ncbi:MAG TPA: aminotransferase class V-fold PLP-dependent enzyme [Steroidobacter sp.]|jgi:selenocysteine lyase/cysteine desulfurase|nr:aminotransferase class V-fold PLP-dependent enzyme [Steroidobacter sp.]
MNTRNTNDQSAASDATLNRRQLLTAICAGVGASLVTDSHRLVHAAPVSAPVNDDAPWRQVKEAFAFEPGYIALNAANLCPTSAPVFEAQLQIMRDVNRDPSFENRARFEAEKEKTRARLANMLGADADEIAITRNTSEGNATIIDGLKLGPGDEVVVWDQNHESNLVAWRVAAKRRGFTVTTVTTPAQPRDQQQLIAPFEKALKRQTRVIAFSHIANMSGTRAPAQALCALARERGVLSLLDGAQSFGMLAVDLHAIGCDFYTGSAHKWLAGPRECGVLYVRKDALDRVWPHMVTHAWSDERERSARKFDCLGQQDDGRIVALGSAVEFHERIGCASVQDRIISLNTSLKEKLAARVAGVQLLTPVPPALSAGITCFTVPNPDGEKIRQILYGTHRISALSVPAGGRTLLRFCPHIYTLPEEIDRAVAAVAAVAAAA